MPVSLDPKYSVADFLVGMSVSPYCLICGVRKQRPGARYCDACNTPHVRERNRRHWQEDERRESDRLRAQEAARYRVRVSVLSRD